MMQVHVDATRTLLLSQGYEPIKIISWQRAMTLLTLDKVEVVEEYDTAIRASSMVINVPAVVRLRKAFRRHAKPVKFSRVNIYARDQHRCQYCGVKCTIDELTYDHVIPRSRGGLTWTTSSRGYDATRTSEPYAVEAGLKLLSMLSRPTWILGADQSQHEVGSRRVARLCV
jgi:hypothetical protein